MQSQSISTSSFYMCLYTNFLLIVRRPTSLNDLQSSISQTMSAEEYASGHFWIATHSFTLLTLKVSLSNDVAFTLHTPMQPLTLIPYDYSWVNPIIDALLATHNLPAASAVVISDFYCNKERDLPGVTLHQVVLNTCFSTALDKSVNLSSLPCSSPLISQSATYDPYNLTAFHYAVLMSNKSFFTTSLIHTQSIDTAFFANSANGASVMDAIIVRGEWVLLKIILSWAKFRIADYKDAVNDKNPIRTALEAPGGKDSNVRQCTQALLEAGFEVDWSVVARLVSKVRFWLLIKW